MTSSFDAELLDSTLGWIASSSDLVRLFEALSVAARSTSAVSPLLSPSSVRTMLDRPAYDRPAPGSAAQNVWYGLGLVVEDGGKTFWHSGTLDGSTSVVARDDVGLTWAALVNCRLELNNDLWDFMRYAVRQVFRIRPSTTPLQHKPIPSHLSSPSTEATANVAQADSSWLQQRDSGASDHNEILRPEPEVRGKEQDGDNGMTAIKHLVDSVSADGLTAVKLMVPSYRVADVVSTVAAARYRPTWLDAVDYRGRIFFNVIWTRNHDQIRSATAVKAGAVILLVLVVVQ